MLCQRPYARDYSILKHIKEEHWSPTLEPKENYFTWPLSDLLMKVPSIKATNGFMFTHQCKLCGKTQMNQMAAAQHVRIDPQGHLSCVASFPDSPWLSDIQCQLLFSGKLGNLCFHCGDVFAHKGSFALHLLKTHGIETERSLKNKCETCGQSFSMASVLRTHMKTHLAERTKDHICDTCGKSFMARKTLLGHKRRVHLTPSRYSCQYCSRTFFQKWLWKTHTQQHLGESPHKCKVCGQGFSKGECLRVHTRIHTGEKPFKCHLCEAAFAQKTSLDVHMKKHRKAEAAAESAALADRGQTAGRGSGVQGEGGLVSVGGGFSSSFQDRRFTGGSLNVGVSSGSGGSHYVPALIGSSSSAVFPSSSSAAGVPSSSSAGVAYHDSESQRRGQYLDSQRRETYLDSDSQRREPYLDSDSQRREPYFDSDSQRREPYLDSESERRGPYLESEAVRRGPYLDSERREHSVEEGSQSQSHYLTLPWRDNSSYPEDGRGDVYVCMLCQRPYARDYSILKHIKEEHWSPTLEPKENYYTRPLSDLLMKVPCYKPGNRNRYGFTHQCRNCGKTSMDQKGAAQHLRVDPQGHLSCVASFPDGPWLSDIHCHLIFSNKLGNLCFHCGDVFVHVGSFAIHLLKVHGIETERSLKNKCETCGQSFSMASVLHTHMKTHLAERAKDHVCETCGKSFMSRKSCLGHKRRVHLLSNRYSCQFCSRTFFHKSRWKVHTQQHLGESPYKCNICGQGFAKGYCLTVHTRIHTGEKPYKCHLCDAAFVQKTSLDLHMKKHRKAETASGGRADRGQTSEEMGGRGDREKVSVGGGGSSFQDRRFSGGSLNVASRTSGSGNDIPAVVGSGSSAVVPFLDSEQGSSSSAVVQHLDSEPRGNSSSAVVQNFDSEPRGNSSSAVVQNPDSEPRGNSSSAVVQNPDSEPRGNSSHAVVQHLDSELGGHSGEEGSHYLTLPWRENFYPEDRR